MFIVLDPAARREPQTIDFYGTSLVFDWCEVDGVRKLAARVPDTAPRMADIRRLVNARSNMRLVKGRSITPIGSDLVALASDEGSLESPKVGLTKAALAMGWDFADLVGTGDNDNPGEAGGRSPRSGLTLAEMGMLPPPTDWAAQADTSWAWQCPGFSALPGWIHPGLAPKATDDVDVDVDDDIDESAPYLAGSKPKDEEDALADDSEAADDLELADDDHTSAHTDDPALDAGYPVEHIAEARALAHKLADERGSTDYHPNAINFFLKKQDLPTVNKAQLAALLAI